MEPVARAPLALGLSLHVVGCVVCRQAQDDTTRQQNSVGELVVKGSGRS